MFFFLSYSLFQPCSLYHSYNLLPYFLFSYFYLINLAYHNYFISYNLMQALTTLSLHFIFSHNTLSYPFYTLAFLLFSHTPSYYLASDNNHLLYIVIIFNLSFILVINFTLCLSIHFNH